MEGRKISWTPCVRNQRVFVPSVLPSECPSPRHPTAPKDWERQAALGRSSEKLRMVSLGYGKKKKITAAVSISIVHIGWDQIWLKQISNHHWFINSNFHYSELSDRPGHTLVDPQESQKQPCEVFQLQKRFCLEVMLSQTQRQQTKLVSSKAGFVHSHWHRTGHCSSHCSAALPQSSNIKHWNPNVSNKERITAYYNTRDSLQWLPDVGWQQV